MYIAYIFIPGRENGAHPSNCLNEANGVPGT